MRVVIQRVIESNLLIDEKSYTHIGRGLLILVGITENDSNDDIEWITRKVLNMRIFNDSNGIMNCSVLDKNFEILIVSQFTLYASTKKGNRPSYIRSAKGPVSEPIFDRLVDKFRAYNDLVIRTGKFGADMKIQLINDGPVTIILDSKNKE
ncbi:MAG: D-aminoacyl-tRNA deacylase [Saprospiraceae bacterium]|jgi:D-tyrosyl-tRNA(Tyr) deacylase